MEYIQTVNRAKSGDSDAFYSLMQMHQAQLYRIAMMYLRNEHAALEAIQEITFRSYKKINQLRNPQYFKTWLIRLLLNYCNDELKKKKRFVYVEKVDAGSINENYFAFDDMYQALTQLEKKYRTVIILKYLEDMTISDIARICRKPEGSIKTWLRRGLLRLREVMEGGERDE